VGRVGGGGVGRVGAGGGVRGGERRLLAGRQLDGAQRGRGRPSTPARWSYPTSHHRRGEGGVRHCCTSATPQVIGCDPQDRRSVLPDMFLGSGWRGSRAGSAHLSASATSTPGSAADIARLGSGSEARRRPPGAPRVRLRQPGHDEAAEARAESARALKEGMVNCAASGVRSATPDRHRDRHPLHRLHRSSGQEFHAVSSARSALHEDDHARERPGRPAHRRPRVSVDPIVAARARWRSDGGHRLRRAERRMRASSARPYARSMRDPFALSPPFLLAAVVTVTAPAGPSPGQDEAQGQQRAAPAEGRGRCSGGRQFTLQKSRERPTWSPARHGSGSGDVHGPVGGAGLRRGVKVAGTRASRGATARSLSAVKDTCAGPRLLWAAGPPGHEVSGAWSTGTFTGFWRAQGARTWAAVAPSRRGVPQSYQVAPLAAEPAGQAAVSP